MIVTGEIIFDPEKVTKKHKRQDAWKKVAIIQFKDDYDDMWRWYLKKRFNLILNQPLRGPHVTIVNDRVDKDKWKRVMKIYNGLEATVEVTNELRNSEEHWWLNVKVLSNVCNLIRNELSLGEPFYPPHYTLGLVNERNIEHSKYIKTLIKDYGY